MKNFYFNKIYVIESLPSGDRKTGKELYDDLLRYQMIKHPKLTAEYKPISSSDEWDCLMNEVAVDCEQNGNQPILHLEIHGEATGQGLVFENGDYVSYNNIRPQLVRINVASQCNLFLTLAVCKGLYMTSTNHLNQPMPFCGLLGAYDIIFENDLAIRFNEFYDELFDSFELAKAYKRLLSVNPGIPHSYRFVHADELFCRVYQNYINENCNDKVIEQRALDAAKENNYQLPNRQLRRKFQRDFEKQEKKTRLRYFIEATKNYFMLDQFPENKDRFEVPANLEELKRRVETLIY